MSLAQRLGLLLLVALVQGAVLGLLFLVLPGLYLIGATMLAFGIWMGAFLLMGSESTFFAPHDEHAVVLLSAGGLLVAAGMLADYRVQIWVCLVGGVLAGMALHVGSARERVVGLLARRAPNRSVQPQHRDTKEQGA